MPGSLFTMALQTGKPDSPQARAPYTQCNKTPSGTLGGVIRHTVNRRAALTVEELAEHYGLAVSSITSLLTREAAAGRPIPAAGHCGRKALYYLRVFDRAKKARPGKGSER